MKVSVLASLRDSAVRLFDLVDRAWESDAARRASGTGLVVLFLGALLATELARRGLLPPAIESFVPKSHFAAIGFAFTALLVLEVISLVLALAQSVAGSVGKQFELFSLILLREAFNELGKLGEPVEWAAASETVLHALAAGAGGLVVFAGVTLYGRLQRHLPITSGSPEQAKFVMVKKLIAGGLLVAFVVAAGDNLARLLVGGDTYPLFSAFFTALIFSDVLIVLVSLRYTSIYAVVFRNAGFALATVLLRLALVTPIYVGVALSVGATGFVVAITLVYNWARADEASGEPETANALA